MSAAGAVTHASRRSPTSSRSTPTNFPSPEDPLVYHLHGRLDILESLVLTEDDYLDFLVAISQDDRLLPHPIQKALAGSSLLFIGYRLADWDFRVLHRGLVMAGEQSLRRLSVTVQIPEHPEANQYLDQYFGAMNVRVFWGTAELDPRATGALGRAHGRWLRTRTSAHAPSSAGRELSSSDASVRSRSSCRSWSRTVSSSSTPRPGRARHRC